MNGIDRVAEATRLRVLDAAQELNYIPDHSAIRLRTGRSNLFGAIINDITNPFFAEFIAEFEVEAWSRGFLTVMATSQDDAERQGHLIRSMLSQGVAGLILSPVHASKKEDLRALRQKSLPYIVCVRDIGDSNSGFGGFDDRAAGEIAGRHLYSYGHRRIAFVGGYEHTATWQLRLEGLRKAAAELRLPDINIQTMSGAEGSAFGCKAVKKLLQSDPTVTAIIGLNDDTANGAYLAAYSMGLRIGVDLSVIGFDNIPQAASLVPGMTTVELFPRRLGKECATRLSQLLDQTTAQTESLRVAPVLIERGSVGPA